ncbi:MAG: phenylalanine--tRNA ligase subunit beta [Candidatus Micrarchaeota archaeon]|nr:phenylalanine--tRNA ligase subunit beta [Candidatus Micrarchaeota archaeon]
MPTLDVSYRDLCNLIGTRIGEEELKNRAIMFAKGEIDEIDGDELKIDEKDTNRPDLWSTEGIAREIAGRYGKEGLPEYKTEASGLVVKVHESVKDVRPLTVCAVVRNLTITEDVLIQIIQLQEKVAGTYGKNRKDVAIGIYDYNKIKGQIHYKGYKPDELSFVPLEFDRELKLSEILKEHPKGKEFGHLLEGKDRYPVFIDDAGNVLSMPPIINSNYTGKVTDNTTDVFIECSGFDIDVLMPALNVIVCALADRGGKIETVDVVYGDKTIKTPDLAPKSIVVRKDYMKQITGLDLDDKEMEKLLKQARYNIAESTKTEIKVEYPAYRQDIMHERDVIEDMLISLGYNEIEPEPVKMITKGALQPMHIFSNKIAEVMIGLGMQEILSYTLTNKENLFTKMETKEKDVCELENPVSANWSVFRNALLAGILEFFSKNKHHELPQKIFEIGNVIIPDDSAETAYRDVQKLACGITATRVTYEEISSVLDAFMRTLDIPYKLRTKDNPSFIKGRCAEILIDGKSAGFVGEIHPQVLNNWDIENPVIAFEIDIDLVFQNKYSKNR